MGSSKISPVGVSYNLKTAAKRIPFSTGSQQIISFKGPGIPITTAAEDRVILAGVLLKLTCDPPTR